MSLFKYSDQVMPYSQDNHLGPIAGTEDDEDSREVIAMGNDVSDAYSIQSPVTPGVDAPEGMADPNAQFNSTDNINMQQQSGTPAQQMAQMASRWTVDSYRHLLAEPRVATNTDLYNQGIDDRQDGKPMDQELAQVSDDYLHGYDQGGFYSAEPPSTSAPAHDHWEMHDGSDDIKRNPVAAIDPNVQPSWKDIRPPRGEALQNTVKPETVDAPKERLDKGALPLFIDQPKYQDLKNAAVPYTPMKVGPVDQPRAGQFGTPPAPVTELAPEEKEFMNNKRNSRTKESEYKYVKPSGGGKYKIVQKGTGKTLSEHDSKEKAEAAFRAMEMHMHGGSKQARRWKRTASEPFALNQPNAVINEEGKNNNEFDPTFDQDPTRKDNMTLDKSDEAGMHSALPPSFHDYEEGLTSTGSVIASTHKVLNDGNWFTGASASIWDRIETLQECIDLVRRTASSDYLEEGDYYRLSSTDQELQEQVDTLQKVASAYVDADVEDYLTSLPGGTVAVNYASLDRNGDIGEDDGSFLYREAAKVRAEIDDLDDEQYIRVSSALWVNDKEPVLLKDSIATREAALYTIFNETLPILDSERRAHIIDGFLENVERERRSAMKNHNDRTANVRSAATTHKEGWLAELEDVFDNPTINWI